jgi:hypothetical protein
MKKIREFRYMELLSALARYNHACSTREVVISSSCSDMLVFPSLTLALLSFQSWSQISAMVFIDF